MVTYVLYDSIIVHLSHMCFIDLNSRGNDILQVATIPWETTTQTIMISHNLISYDDHRLYWIIYNQLYTELL